MAYGQPSAESPVRTIINATHPSTGVSINLSIDPDVVVSDTANSQAMQALVDAIDAAADLTLDSAYKMWSLTREITPDA